MMGRKSIIHQYWIAAAEKEGWYPLYRDTLDGVDTDLAKWRPPGISANTVWETYSVAEVSAAGGITVFANVRLNNQLELVDLSTISEATAKQMRDAFERHWNCCVGLYDFRNHSLYGSIGKQTKQI